MVRWLYALAVTPLLAQSRSAIAEQRIVAELLASPEPARQAWGAHLAGNYGQVKFVDPVVRLLGSPHPEVQLHALDAVIRLNAEVPSQTLEVLLRNFPNHALILISRRPENYRHLLLNMLRGPLYDLLWAAANNILIQLKDREAIAGLLRDFRIQLRLLIVDSGSAHGVSGAMGGVTIGCGPVSPKSDFPPPVFYRLVNEPQPGDVLLGPGRHPIHYRRSADASTKFTHVDRDRYRQENLADLLHIEPRNLPLESHPSRTIEWRGAEAYVDQMRGIRTDLLRGFRETSGLLVARGLLGESDTAGLQPDIHIYIHDERRERTPLPAH
jgi:hypothetical protein